MLQNATCHRTGDLLMEYQTNEFAAALLMPIKAYKEIMNRHTIGNKVEYYFGISISAASDRGNFFGFCNVESQCDTIKKVLL